VSISTKTGDKGQTSLWSGERISKDDIRVEAYGTLDELDSHIGEARHFVKIEENRQLLEEIQSILSRVMGELASVQKKFHNPIGLSEVEMLTNQVHKYEEIVKLKGFVLLGNTLQSAKLDVCRTIARRAERRILSLNKDNSVSEFIIAFVNRLSDLLYMMARHEEKAVNALKYKTS